MRVVLDINVLVSAALKQKSMTVMTALLVTKASDAPKVDADKTGWQH